MPVASPAVFEKIGTRFRQAVARFADSPGACDQRPAAGN